MKTAPSKLCNPQFTIEGDGAHLERLQLTRHDCLELAGGIPVFEEFPLECRITIHDSLYISVVVESSVYRAMRSLFFGHKIIQNDRLIVMESRRGIGKILFHQQLEAARKFQFERITLMATGGDITGGDWIGHYVWGRFGFSMHKDEINSFRDWQEIYSCTGETIFEMLKTPDSKKKWFRDGYTWDGYFLTNPRSQNSKDFLEYLGGT